MFYRVPPNMEYVSFGEGVVSNHLRHKWPPLFSRESHPNGIDSRSTISVPFEAGTGAFTTSSGHASTTELEAPEYKACCQSKLQGLIKTKSKPRVPNGTLEQGALKQMRGKCKSLR
jgi:hypothetical protein